MGNLKKAWVDRDNSSRSVLDSHHLNIDAFLAGNVGREKQKLLSYTLPLLCLIEKGAVEVTWDDRVHPTQAPGTRKIPSLLMLADFARSYARAIAPFRDSSTQPSSHISTPPFLQKPGKILIKAPTLIKEAKKSRMGPFCLYEEFQKLEPNCITKDVLHTLIYA